jgi:5-carboxymethyl-2-hydroxymuconate isomerase
MAHLSFEYSNGLGRVADLDQLCATLRDEMMASGVFPLAGIRVRGFEADVMCIADGGAHHFVDMVLRMGQGRDIATRNAVADKIYSAARGALMPRISTGFMLSLEVVEIDASFSRKSWNTVREKIGDTVIGEPKN